MTKMKWVKSSLCITLAFVMASSFVGCGTKKVSSSEVKPMEIEEVYKYSFECLGSDVMPIMGFYGPERTVWSSMGNDMPDFLTDEYFQAIADVGVNVMSYTQLDYANTPDKVRKLLDLGAKYGVGISVTDSRICSDATKTPNVESIEQLDAFLSEYADHPAFACIHVVDEPGMEGFRAAQSEIPDFANLFDMLHQLKIPAYGTVFSNLSQPQDLYAEYLQAWKDTAKLPYLQYDFYLDEANAGLRYARNWFETMSTIRSEAEEGGIPFWVFVQAGAQWNDARNYFDSQGYYPLEGLTRWNVGAALAFGAKGINYFLLTQPLHFALAETNFYDFERNGLMGAIGNKNRWYYYAQQINAQIAAVDSVLMNSVNKGIIASGENAKTDLSATKYLMEGTSWRELANVDGDAMIGCFNYQGKTALYVLNYDYEYAQKIKLDFVDNCNVTIIQDAVERQECGESLTLTLSAGNSALVVFE